MNENILVIEHRAELLEKIVDILKERHYNPISTKSRSQAINISNETSIDLIIIDADIGDSQGLQLLDTFKNQENGIQYRKIRIRRGIWIKNGKYMK